MTVDASPDTETRELGEEERVQAWRLRELLRSGYPKLEAQLLASDGAVDLHRACDLVGAGCAPDMAARILL